MRLANLGIIAVLGWVVATAMPAFAQPDVEPGPGVLSSEQMERLRSLPPHRAPRRDGSPAPAVARALGGGQGREA